MVSCLPEGPKREPIVLSGDFNINARASRGDGSQHSPEYSSMMALLSEVSGWNDCLLERYKEHPITYGDSGDPDAIGYGDGKRRPQETLLTEKGAIGTCQSVDYLLFAGDKTGSCDLKLEDVSVDPFLTDNSEFTHLSGKRFHNLLSQKR